MGTKPKFWLENPTTNRRVLVKYARVGTGEDWSEKLACDAFRVWKEHFKRATLPALVAEVRRIPPECLSDEGKRFVRGLLEHNYHRIIEIVP